MSFTYEFENKNERLETYEWDNVYHDTYAKIKEAIEK